MKRNMAKTMQRLKIDEGIRDLIGKMWKHGYRTLHSCSGHEASEDIVYFEDPTNGDYVEVPIFDSHAGYVCFERGTGDGWFERNLPSGFSPDSEDSSALTYQTNKRVLTTVFREDLSKRARRDSYWENVLEDSQ